MGLVPRMLLRATAGLAACLATHAVASVTVSLPAPTNGSVHQAGVNITLSATATASKGYTLSKVEFYQGTTLIGGDTSAPYSIVWNSVPAGNYSLTAKAIATKKNKPDQTALSVTVNVTVNATAALLHFIHVDHLNTPRAVYDQVQQLVWRWDNAEPFGDTPPDDNPSGLGVFDFDFAFPGQRRDKETGNWHNWMRDYSPLVGRFIQSDPLGLEVGLNTYAYVGSMPLRYSDPTGLETYQCRRPLGGLPGDNQRSGPDIWGNPLFHQYSCTRDPATGKLVCGGQGFAGSWWSSPGKATTPQTDYYDPVACKKSEDDNPCFEKCLIEEWAKKRPRYGVPFGTDCQEYDDNVNSVCRKICGLK